MPRAAFRLRIKATAIEGYERDHQNVWPELLAKLKEVGISDYSIFRRGQDKAGHKPHFDPIRRNRTRSSAHRGRNADSIR